MLNACDRPAVARWPASRHRRTAFVRHSRIPRASSPNSADRSPTGSRLNVVIEHLVGKLCILDSRPSSAQFSRRANEDADFVWHDTLVGPFRKPSTYSLDFGFRSLQNHDVRLWTVER